MRLSVFVCLASTLFAAPSFANSSATPLSYSDLQSIAGKYIKTFGREVVLYNYLRASSGYSDPRSGEMESMIKRLTRVYLNPGSRHEPSFQLGSGLYLASDPINGKRYTYGSPWRLMSLSFGPQTRYIDLRGSAQSPILASEKSDSFANVVVETQGCATYRCQDLRAIRCELKSLRSLFEDTATPDCRALTLRLIHDLKIQLVGYLWDGLGYTPCAPKAKNPEINNTAEIAFVISDEEAVDLSRSRYLSSNLPKKADGAELERQVIGEIVRRAGLSGNEDPFPNLPKTITDAEFDQYVTTTQFGCVPQRYPQDRPF